MTTSKNLSDELIKVVFASTKATNTLKEELKKSLIHDSAELFTQAYTEFETQYPKLHPEKKEDDMQMTLAKNICAATLEFIQSNQFQEDKVNEYAVILNKRINVDFFAFMLWSQDKKDATFSLFKNNKIKLSEEQYNSLQHVLEIHTYNRNMPLGENEIQAYLAKQKQEFFYYQKNYTLLEELRNLPTKVETTKKIKI